MSKLLEELLALPTAPGRPRTARREDFTTRLEVKGDEATLEVSDEPNGADESAAREHLKRKGEDPDQWVAVGFASSEWTRANGDLGESVKYRFARVGTPGARAALGAMAGALPVVDDLLAAVVRKARPRKAPRPEGEHAFIVAIGDLQIGKIDGDGVEGTVARTVAYLERAAELLSSSRDRFDIGHCHVAWMGDHLEGFSSQGGANVWRTQLSLNEQLRVVRRLMLYAVEVFAPVAQRVSMVAVPGNHGEPQRFAGKGLTRYDDSHDTEALIAVSEACKLNPAAFGHVEFYVPSTDEMIVVLDVAGTVVGHAHGHQWKPGRHMEWWKGQSFGGSPLGEAHLLLAGHLHHFFVDTSGPRTFLQVPALESESTWWRHATGEPGAPGLVVLVTKDGLVGPVEVVR